MKPIEIAVIGAGGFGREVAWLINCCNKSIPRYETVCFISEVPHGHKEILNDIPVLNIDEAYERFPSAKVVRAIGSPVKSERAVREIISKGFQFETIIHPNVEMSEFVRIGEGTVICAGNIITTNITIGEHVQLNLDCTIGHDAILGDFTSLAPGVHISGCVHIGKRVYIGTGAVIINGTADNPLVVNDDVVIGAGACVTKSIEAGRTVVGVPAKPID